MNLEVYTDGSATTSDKPGGYGWVMVIDGQKVSEGSGYMDQATNNDAELEAAIKGLAFANEYLKDRWQAMQLMATVTNAPLYSVTLVSDSQIILGWATGHYAFRQENKRGKYNELQLLMQILNAQTRWVEGHTGDEHNERCDKLANCARLGTDINSLKDTSGSAKIKKIETYEGDLARLKHKWQLCKSYPHCQDAIGCHDCKFEKHEKRH